MKKIGIFQVDAFTDRLFSGNPAAVCILDHWLSDDTMQSIAAENNLAETAFLVPAGGNYAIRWFTPLVEVDLCGHATLAAAFVLFECTGQSGQEITFLSPRSGELKVLKQEELLFLDFPADTISACDEIEQIKGCLNYQPMEVYKGKTDYLAVIDSEEAVYNLKPDFGKISGLKARGLIVTARGNEVDFVSRFFAPQCGIDEDPVTGSAHTSLIPLWAMKLAKNKMQARQLSKRGGYLICENKGRRSLIGGSAVLYMTGEVHLDE